ncbi:T3SS negative regulator,GrlR [Ensifer sp. YR511]|nr:T3SS negative regulator,GrlR [Ensifer sp. YR511]
MRNGLYRVHFQTPLGSGAGVVHAIDGKMWGGDAGLYYVGSYTTVGDRLTAVVTTDRHTAHNGVTSVFGVDKATINLDGRVSGDNISAKGTSPQAPGINFTAELSRVSD